MSATARIAIAGLSVRALAEAARRDGLEVLALDLFGDADTLAASAQWQPIGDSATLQIDAQMLLAALRQAAAAGELLGWVAGSGFDGRPDLLAAGQAVLPLLGCPPEAVAAVRHPQRFFATLDAWGMPHPEVAFRRPPEGAGWLHKQAGSSGGTQVRPAQADDADPPAPGSYWQRELPGRSLSVTLLATGAPHAPHVAVLGVNEQITAPTPSQPYRFAGVLGPLTLPGRLPTALQGMAERLVADFQLRGLCGMDFLLLGDELQLLEVNPRPPASATLYGAQGGLATAHLRACLQGQLPDAAALAALRPQGLAGQLTVFAQRPLRLSTAQLQHLAARDDLHDLPGAPLQLGTGEPLCSIQRLGDDAAGLRAELLLAADALLADLETRE